MTKVLTVRTKNANYVVDREGIRWMRQSDSHPRPNDGEWIAGGFTLGEVGQSCFAHFADFPGDALGRRTSKVVAIDEGQSA